MIVLMVLNQHHHRHWWQNHSLHHVDDAVSLFDHRPYPPCASSTSHNTCRRPMRMEIVIPMQHQICDGDDLSIVVVCGCILLALLDGYSDVWFLHLILVCHGWYHCDTSHRLVWNCLLRHCCRHAVIFAEWFCQVACW